MLDFLNTNDHRPWHEIDSRKQKAKRFSEVLVESVKSIFIDNVPQWAAAISYYALLSAFPLLLIGTMIKALNIAYDVDDPYSFFQRLLIEAIMLFTIGLFFIAALTSGFFLNLLWEALRLVPGNGQNVMLTIIQGVVGALVVLAGFFLVYRFMPKTDQNWRSALAGAAVAGLLFVLARPLFLYYIETFGNYNVIYGSLALLVILMIWVWMTAMITLFGGEVASHTQAMLIEGQSREDVERKHRERSPGTKAA